jgi:hypothetical protein
MLINVIGYFFTNFLSADLSETACGEAQGKKWKNLSFQRARSKAQPRHIPNPCPQRSANNLRHKEIKVQRGLRQTRYANVNKQARALEESRYVKKIGIKKTKAGFQASIYELITKAYLAILLNSINLEDLIIQVDETTASAILGALTSTR